MKSVVKRILCVMCVTVMLANVTACGFDVSTSFGTPIGNDQSPVEYNTEYLTETFELEDVVAEIIAEKLDEKGLGKIKSYKKKIANGTGSFTFGDGKKKYTINVEDGYITTLTDSDGMVIMTIDEILELANGPQTDDFTSDISTDPDFTASEPDVTTEPDDTTVSSEPDTTVNTSSGTASYLPEETQKILATIGSDYPKINWGVQYSPTGMDGIVISVAPYQYGNNINLLVGITNLYNEDVTFSANGYAKNTSGENIGNISFYELAIRPGYTVVKNIYCDDIPTGEIRWESIELPDVFDQSVSYEADWAIGQDDQGFLQVTYKIMSPEVMQPGTVTAVILDSKGNILAVSDDYNIEKGKELTGEINYYVNELPGTPTDLAFFANPLVP